MPTPEDKISEFAPNWAYHRPGIFTDPIWMEYSINRGDPEVTSELSAVRLETVANVLRAIADGAANAAKAVRSAQSGD